MFIVSILYSNLGVKHAKRFKSGHDMATVAPFVLPCKVKTMYLPTLQISSCSLLDSQSSIVEVKIVMRKLALPAALHNKTENGNWIVLANLLSAINNSVNPTCTLTCMAMRWNKHMLTATGIGPTLYSKSNITSKWRSRPNIGLKLTYHYNVGPTFQQHCFNVSHIAWKVGPYIHYPKVIIPWEIIVVKLCQ